MEEDRDPANWKAAVDASTGKTYWYVEAESRFCVIHVDLGIIGKPE